MTTKESEDAAIKSDGNARVIRMAIIVSKEEKILRENRHKQFVYLLDKYKVKTRKLALLSGIDEHNLSAYKSGKMPITENVWVNITKGFELLDNELAENIPNVEVADWEYVKQQLARHDNVFVNKKKVKNITSYIQDLKLNGFDCSYQEVDDGYIISHNRRVIKPMVEIIKSKPKVEEDLSIISKVRSMHEDSLVLHEEALKLQAETDKIVKSVDDMEARIKESITSAFVSEPTIEITDKAIAEAQDYNKAIYQPTEEEKEELKELAEETLANCGLEKGIHSVDLVQFLETRFTKQEVRGFLRGKAIESLLEEDYQTAAMCIKYFTDKGYIEMGEGV